MIFGLISTYESSWVIWDYDYDAYLTKEKAEEALHKFVSSSFLPTEPVEYPLKRNGVNEIGDNEVEINTGIWGALLG